MPFPEIGRSGQFALGVAVGVAPGDGVAVGDGSANTRCATSSAPSWRVATAPATAPARRAVL
ncbi:hypothetical protein [Kitasatospora sp. NBC_00458]|uniref:hypothetical protein n=1 Tax=Kitasatospora sp. NBC_00458 TaxID=2903568 RepID=UPI002E19AE08